MLQLIVQINNKIDGKKSLSADHVHKFLGKMMKQKTEELL
jgi:hypothetical protein